MGDHAILSARCGAFAIAFAYHAAIGDDLRQIQFDQQRMRGHIVQCFEKRKFSPFPKQKVDVIKTAEHNIFAFVLLYVA